jgi:uncharacterized delta-60 repeat protein
MSTLPSVFALALLAVPAIALAQPGIIDPSFGGGDIVYNQWGTGGGYGVLNWVGCQSTGKVIGVGRPAGSGGNGFYLLLGAIRYNADGTVDPTFGQNGSTIVQAPYQLGLAGTDAAIQADDKIVMHAAGFQVVRLTANGALDTSFGSHGVASVSDNKHTWVGGAVAVQHDGKIVLAGFSIRNSGRNNTWDVTIARFNSNGSLDTTFGNFGHGSTPGYIVDTQAGNQQINAHCLAIQPDGKILLAEWGTDNRSSVARYLSTGAPDSTFGVAGHCVFSITGNDVPLGMCLSPDGRIVITGHSGADATVGFFARFTASGALDTSFGTGGGVVREFPGGVDVGYGGLAMQADGSVLTTVSLPDGGQYVSGQTVVGPTFDMAAWRVTASGVSDPIFGPEGDGVSSLIGAPNVWEEVGHPPVPVLVGVYDDARAITVDPFGRIIVGGSRGSVGPEIAAIRGQ